MQLSRKMYSPKKKLDLKLFNGNIPTASHRIVNEIVENCLPYTTCADPEGGGAGGPELPPPLGKLQKYKFLSNTGLDSLKNHKANKPALNIRPSSARQQNAI